ncbi:MAG: hypothetical protein IJW03_01030 [Clostridia bacterium]|nr:hypothetical protein [Clostridia bacterium]
MSFASCAIFGDDNASDDTVKDESYNKIVYSSDELDLLDVRSKIFDLLGPVGSVAADAEKEARGEIVFGDTARSVTLAAKEALERELASSSKYDIGYIIYASGGSVAIYWQLDEMADIAIAHFGKECVDNMKLELSDGIVAIKLYEQREFDDNKKWLAIEAKHGSEVASALRRLYNYYDGPKIAGWLANLYDPEIGGFYYSRSARDYKGFLPDLESTQQVFGILSNLGAMPQRDTMMPDDLKRKIVEFARGLQSEKDGYFYHPQWPQDKNQLATDRYGRDQGNAMSIISKFTYDTDGDGVADKLYPKYCTVEGDKCAIHDGTKESCSFPIATAYITDRMELGSFVSTSITSSVSSAVSRLNTSTVKTTASVSDRPDYSSAAAFKAWLEAYNAGVGVDSGNAHNLAAISAEIYTRGYGDILIQHIKDSQKKLFDEQVSNGEEPTGIWQRDYNYRAVWGTYKYMAIFNSSIYDVAIDLEYAPYMIKSCLEVVKLEPKKDYAYNDLMNQWTAITNVISNVKKHYGDDEANKLYEIVREDPVFLIENTLAKLEPFKMEDGSFCVRVDGTTPANIYGVNVAVGGLSEGTVNSTHIIVNMYGCICSALGLPKVSLCTTKDGEAFVETISTIEPIDKIEMKAEDALDFEGNEIPTGVSMNQTQAGSSISIDENPDGDGNVLYYHSAVGASTGDAVVFNATGSGSGLYVFESDMYITSESTSGKTLLQLKFTGSSSTAYMLQMKISGKEIVISESTTISSGGIVNELERVSVNEWFTLRIEYYDTIDSLGAPTIVVYVDEKEVVTSQNFYKCHIPGTLPETTFSRMEVFSLKSVESHVYFDNTHAYRSNTAYEE